MNSYIRLLIRLRALYLLQVPTIAQDLVLQLLSHLTK